MSFPVDGIELDIPRVPARAGFQNGNRRTSFSSADWLEIFFLVFWRPDGVQNGATQNDCRKERT